jgi:hypothetical protein
MDQIFDLFGDPVPRNWNRRGRPGHVRTQENRNKVSMLLAFGWNNERIARALRISMPTLLKYYFVELDFRAEQRDRMDAWLAFSLAKQVDAGNVAAMKEFRKVVEKNDLMLYGQANPPPAKDPKLGKKEQAELAALNPDRGSALGDLIAQRQGAGRPN